MTEILSLQNITFTYDLEQPEVKNAVEDVSFSVEQGEWIAIVGHNGSGKSTIAKIMNGLLFPQEGTVEIFGMPMNEENLWSIRSQLGMVFQNPDNQFVGATVQDDVAFALENNGVPYEDMVSRVEQALEQVKMSGFMNHEPQHLSGGQKQRVAIAGALALRPKLLILDEATSMLDPQGRQEVLDTVRTLREETGLTVLSITHDLEEAILADRLLFMNQGEKFAEGKPSEIFALGEQLIALGLDLPFSMKMAHLLMQEGVSLEGTHMSERELVEDLWISNFKK
ncbi:MAG: energy-coupling factor ABC transporter ATP-binding protein [Kurthia gibsonii]|uniref:Energy-coupling factor ABC transporter ATP-binding protein n=1 Tax=Kurthia gibsonii TaxID=33946 RepID=A0ABU9LQR5_9BACL|nr:MULTISPECIES: energy-coupling factor ABC transporter ATP-binding protein [Kurthia]AMA64552.1 ABC transporter family protein [Kurthia sp. 11kri321]MEB7773033.1 energy-coupling factor ABC transporter ATP-binding protein [Kurthia gibsonii]RXH53053.1 energy-coupling factor ABC transporter ATP-binding protein [Kurthia gibsonii]WIL38530.1 energy-coupling factor ABC transporter ATP-binding protein [Kurthia sp. YJT4]HZG11347.1 energy-coupling factor ABC transporter ATP-binding protein [Kurthia gibs